MPTVVTALAFDSSQELLWAGNGYVRLTRPTSLAPIPGRNAIPDSFPGPCYILLCKQPSKVHIIPRAPAVRGCGAPAAFQ